MVVDEESVDDDDCLLMTFGSGLERIRGKNGRRGSKDFNMMIVGLGEGGGGKREEKTVKSCPSFCTRIDLMVIFDDPDSILK